MKLFLKKFHSAPESNVPKKFLFNSIIFFLWFNVNRFYWNQLSGEHQRLPWTFVPERSCVRGRHQQLHVSVPGIVHRPLLQPGRGRVRSEAFRLQKRSHLHQHARRIFVHLRQRMDRSRLFGEHRRLRRRRLLQWRHLSRPCGQLLLPVCSRYKFFSTFTCLK